MKESYSFYSFYVIISGREKEGRMSVWIVNLDNGEKRAADRETEE